MPQGAGSVQGAKCTAEPELSHSSLLGSRLTSDTGPEFDEVCARRCIKLTSNSLCAASTFSMLLTDHMLPLVGCCLDC